MIATLLGGKRRRYSVSTPIQSVVRPYTRSEPYSRNAEPITFRRTKSAKATYSSKSPLLLAESFKRNQNNDVASRQKYSSKSPLSLRIPAHSGSPSHMPAHRSRSSSCNQKKSSEKSSIASLHSPERELGQDTQMSPDLLDGEKPQSPPVQEQAEDITMPSLKEKDNQDAENEGLSDRSHSQQSPRMSVRSGPDRENSRASNSQCSEVAPVVGDGENTEGNVEETYVSTDESSEGLSVYPGELNRSGRALLMSRGCQTHLCSFLEPSLWKPDFTTRKTYIQWNFWILLFWLALKFLTGSMPFKILFSFVFNNWFDTYIHLFTVLYIE